MCQLCQCYSVIWMPYQHIINTALSVVHTSLLNIDYKSKKMDKLLAALSLPQVGAITQIPKEKDPEGQVGLFALELNSRMYTLRAKDDEEAAKWVHVLETLRQQGIAAAAKEAEARGGSTTVNVRAKSGIEMETVGVSNSGSSSSAASDASWIKSSNPYCCC